MDDKASTQAHIMSMMMKYDGAQILPVVGVDADDNDEEDENDEDEEDEEYENDEDTDEESADDEEDYEDLTSDGNGFTSDEGDFVSYDNGDNVAGSVAYPGKLVQSSSDNFFCGSAPVLE